jgi:hypothetical protein
MSNYNILLLQARRNFICILPKSEMHTEQGTVRKYWLHKFYELNPEDKKRVRIPKVGAIAEERITIKVPNYGSFYLLSYKKEHADWGEFTTKSALYKGIIYAEIIENKIILSDHSEFYLKDCQADAY